MSGDGRPARYIEALQELAGTHASVLRKSELRDEMSRMARLGSPRPLSLHGYGHFYRLLKESGAGATGWVAKYPRM